MGWGKLSRTDQFAEYLAEGLTLREIAERMGLSRGAAAGIFRRIRIGLGEHAE